MAKDFKSNQIRVGKLIGSNSNSSEPKLIVYPDSSVLDGSGGINPNMLSNVGTRPRKRVPAEDAHPLP